MARSCPTNELVGYSQPSLRDWRRLAVVTHQCIGGLFSAVPPGLAKVGAVLSHQ
jgi:hypothetical protein